MTKHINDYTLDELHNQLIEGFLKPLNIAGSTANYDLYHSIGEAMKAEKENKPISEWLNM